MYIFDYWRHRITIKEKVRQFIVFLCFIAITGLLFYQNRFLDSDNREALKNVVTSITSLHNQMYFLLPMLTIGNLILFNKPDNIEYFLLIKNKMLKRYFITLSIIPVLMIAISYLAGMIFMILKFNSIIDLRNSWLGIYLVICNLLGVYVYVLIVNLIVALFNKLKALIIAEIFILIDYFIFNMLGFSILLTNGLSLPSVNYGFNIITNILIYLAYLIIIDMYLSTLNFERKINYE